MPINLEAHRQAEEKAQQEYKDNPYLVLPDNIYFIHTNHRYILAELERAYAFREAVKKMEVVSDRLSGPLDDNWRMQRDSALSLWPEV